MALQARGLTRSTAPQSVTIHAKTHLPRSAVLRATVRDGNNSTSSFAAATQRLDDQHSNPTRRGLIFLQAAAVLASSAAAAGPSLAAEPAPFITSPSGLKVMMLQAVGEVSG